MPKISTRAEVFSQTSAFVSYLCVGSLIYRRVPGGLELEGAGFGNGRIVVSDTGDGLDYTPLYFVTDHLGSTRVVVKLTDDGPEVLERSDYLPYGGRWEQSGTAITDNRFRFNGKELQTTGFPYTAGILDYGWRVYGPRLGRWNNPDPLAELYLNQSDYAFVGNNPIRHIELDGRSYRGYTYNWLTKRYEDENGNEVSWWDIWGEVRRNNDYIPAFEGGGLVNFGIGSNGGSLWWTVSGQYYDLAYEVYGLRLISGSIPITNSAGLIHELGMRQWYAENPGMEIIHNAHRRLGIGLVGVTGSVLSTLGKSFSLVGNIGAVSGYGLGVSTIGSVFSFAGSGFEAWYGYLIGDNRIGYRSVD